MRKGIWKDYFSFSKRERIGVIILLALIVIFVILPYLFSPQFKKPVVDEQFQKQLASLKDSFPNDEKSNRHQSSFVADTTIKDIKADKHLFYFDPNTLNEAGWKKLGLRDKTIQTIINYRNKGGYFKRPDDIRKIYGLKKEEADELVPYIQIKTATTANEQNQKDTKKTQEKNTVSTIKKIDINTATAEDFKSLPGIGDVLGNRMVKFRNAIHGFKSVEDIKKTYGLPDSTYQQILPYLTIGDTLLKN